MEETRITFEEGTRRIVLPQAVKQIMGWDKKNPVEIWLNAADDAVILKRLSKQGAPPPMPMHG